MVGARYEVKIFLVLGVSLLAAGTEFVALSSQCDASHVGVALHWAAVWVGEQDRTLPVQSLGW